MGGLRNYSILSLNSTLVAMHFTFKFIDISNLLAAFTVFTTIPHVQNANLKELV